MTLLDDLTAARLDWTSPALARWYSPADLDDRVRASMTTPASWVGDGEFGATFRDNIASVDDAGRYAVPDPLDWANRLVAAGDGWAVTGIRFRALDLDKPFVDVVATSLPPTADALATIADVVLPQYRSFAPLALRVDAPDPDALVAALRTDPRFAGAQVDQYVVAGLVSELRARAKVPAYHRVSLRPADAADLAQRAASLYADLAAGRPDLLLWTNPSDGEELASAQARGLAFEVLVDGEPAGVLAADRMDEHALSGFQVVEIVLDGAHLGQRLAPGILQRLLDELPAGDGDTLWGTIHPDNLPSRRNAASIGREVVGGFVWVLPAGSPGI